MNYALDALWWRLKTPVVRDLGSLLTAPAPWHSGCELQVSTLLGEKGFRFLLDLDDKPELLHRFLKRQTAYHNRLGVYAERLLTFWFSYAPHCQLIATNLPVTYKQKTIGAADFIVKLNGLTYHLELACKYYRNESTNSPNFVGLNTSDTLNNKISKIKQQLALSQCAEGIKTFQSHGIDTTELRHASIIRGMLFTDSMDLPSNPNINLLCWQGTWIEHWQQLTSQLNLDEKSRFYVLNRLSLLSPARVNDSGLIPFSQVRQICQGFLVLLQQRGDGYWHEIQRIMKIDCDNM